MKKIIIFIQMLFISSICLMAAQTMTDVWDNMSELTNDLRGLWQKISPDCDFNKIEAQYSANGTMMDACLSSGSEIILESKDLLYPIYIDYKTLYLKTGEAIQKAKAEKQKKENIAMLKKNFENYETQMTSIAEVAEKHSRKGKTDSLEVKKRHAITLYSDAMAYRTTYRNCFENDTNLETLWNSVDKKYCFIVALTPAKNNIWNALFKIIIVLGILLMVYNMLGSKIKLNKLFKKPAENKPQNDDNEVYTQQL